MDTCCPGTSQRSYCESKLLQGRLPGCWAGETPHTPASLLRAHFSLSQLSRVQSWISRQWMWKNKQTGHTICPEPPRRFPGLSFCQQKMASWGTLCLLPSLLSQYRCFSWEAHPFILMPNAPAAPAVTKIDRLSRKQWRLCQASPWWRWRPGSIPVSRTSTSTLFLLADMYITDTHDPRHQEAFQKSPS